MNRAKYKSLYDNRQVNLVGSGIFDYLSHDPFVPELEKDSVNIEARLADGTNFLEKNISLIPNGPAGVQWYKFHATFLISSSSKLDYYCVKVSEPNGQSDDVPANNEKCFSRIKEMA